MAFGGISGVQRSPVALICIGSAQFKALTGVIGVMGLLRLRLGSSAGNFESLERLCIRVIYWGAAVITAKKWPFVCKSSRLGAVIKRASRNSLYS